MNRYRSIVLVVLIFVGGCAGFNLADFTPQSPREALVLAEITFAGSTEQLKKFRDEGVIDDEAWGVIKEVVRDIRDGMRLARSAVKKGDSPYVYLDVVNDGLAILRRRLLEIDK